MADAAKEARADLRRAQVVFERAQAQREEASAARRKSFEKAQASGLSLRDIAEETGLHFSRVAEVLRGQ